MCKPGNEDKVRREGEQIGEERNALNMLVGKPKGKRQLGRPRRLI
jgi:hypothetical protein